MEGQYSPPGQVLQKAPITIDEIQSQDDEMKVRNLFMQTLLKMHEERGSPLKRLPIIGHKELDIFKLFLLVELKGGFRFVISNKLFKAIGVALEFPTSVTNSGYILRNKYEQILLPFEDQLREIFFRRPPPIHEHTNHTKCLTHYVPTSKPYSNPNPSQFTGTVPLMPNVSPPNIQRYQLNSINNNTNGNTQNNISSTNTNSIDMSINTSGNSTSSCNGNTSNIIEDSIKGGNMNVSSNMMISNGIGSGINNMTQQNQVNNVISQQMNITNDNLQGMTQHSIPAQRRQTIPQTMPINIPLSMAAQSQSPVGIISGGSSVPIVIGTTTGLARTADGNVVLTTPGAALQRFIPQGVDLDKYQILVQNPAKQNEKIPLHNDLINVYYDPRRGVNVQGKKDDMETNLYLEKYPGQVGESEEGHLYRQSPGPQFQIIPPLSKNPPIVGYYGMNNTTRNINSDFSGFNNIISQQNGITAGNMVNDLYRVNGLNTKGQQNTGLNMGLKLTNNVQQGRIQMPLDYGVNAQRVQSNKVVRNNIVCPICSKLDNYLSFKKHLKGCDYGLYKMLYESNVSLKNNATDGSDLNVNTSKRNNKGQTDGIDKASNNNAEIKLEKAINGIFQPSKITQNLDQRSLMEKTMCYIHAKSLLLAKLQLRNSDTIMSNIQVINYLFIHFLFHKLLMEATISVVERDSENNKIETMEDTMSNVGYAKSETETTNDGDNLKYLLYDTNEMKNLKEFINVWPSSSLILDGCVFKDTCKSQNELNKSQKFVDIRNKDDSANGDNNAQKLLGYLSNDNKQTNVDSDTSSSCYYSVTPSGTTGSCERIDSNDVIKQVQFAAIRKTPIDKVIYNLTLRPNINTIDINNTSSMVTFTTWFNQTKLCCLGEANGAGRETIDSVQNIVISNFFFSSAHLKELLEVHPNLKRVELKTSKQHSHRFNCTCDPKKTCYKPTDQHTFEHWPEPKSLKKLKHIVIEEANPLFNVGEFFKNNEVDSTSSVVKNNDNTNTEELAEGITNKNVIKTIMLRYHTISRSSTDLLQCRKAQFASMTPNTEPPICFKQLGDLLTSETPDGRLLQRYIKDVEKYYKILSRNIKEMQKKSSVSNSGSRNATPIKQKSPDDPLENIINDRKNEEQTSTPLFKQMNDDALIPTSNIITTPYFNNSSDVLEKSSLKLVPSSTFSVQSDKSGVGDSAFSSSLKHDSNLVSPNLMGSLNNTDIVDNNGGLQIKNSDFNIINYANDMGPFMNDHVKPDNLLTFGDASDMFTFPNMDFGMGLGPDDIDLNNGSLYNDSTLVNGGGVGKISGLEENNIGYLGDITPALTMSLDGNRKKDNLNMNSLENIGDGNNIISLEMNDGFPGFNPSLMSFANKDDEFGIISNRLNNNNMETNKIGDVNGIDDINFSGINDMVIDRNGDILQKSSLELGDTNININQNNYENETNNNDNNVVEDRDTIINNINDDSECENSIEKGLNETIPTYLTAFPPRNPFIFKFRGRTLKSINILKRNISDENESENSQICISQSGVSLKSLILYNCIIDLESMLLKCSGVETIKLENCILLPMLQHEQTTNLNDENVSGQDKKDDIIKIDGMSTVKVMKRRLRSLKHLSIVNTIGSFHVKTVRSEDNSLQFYCVKLGSGDEININERY